MPQNAESYVLKGATRHKKSAFLARMMLKIY